MPKKRIRDSETASERMLARARRLITMTTVLTAARIVDDMVEVIVEGAAELLDAETSSLMLLDEETNELIVVAATAASGRDAMRYRIPPGRGIAGWVVEHGKAIVSNDPRSDPRFFGTIDQVIGFESRNILAMPLTIQNRCIGVIEVLNKGGGFTEDDEELAAGLAACASLALENARLHGIVAEMPVEPRFSFNL